jgi:hypothetical protein
LASAHLEENAEVRTLDAARFVGVEMTADRFAPDAPAEIDLAADTAWTLRPPAILPHESRRLTSLPCHLLPRT